MKKVYINSTNRKSCKKQKKDILKKKAAESYLKNNAAIKEKSKKLYKSLSREDKDKIKEHQRKRY